MVMIKLHSKRVKKRLRSNFQIVLGFKTGIRQQATDNGITN